MKQRYDTNAKAHDIVVVRRQQRRLSVTGLLMILVGVLAIIMPVGSSFAVNFLIGATLTFGGALAVLLALLLRGTRSFVWPMLGALLPLCLGLYLLFFPTLGLATLTAFIAVVLLITGVSQSILALAMRGFGWFLFSGLISIALGVLILAVLPQASTVLLGTLLGIDLISTGLALVLINAALTRAF